MSYHVNATTNIPNQDPESISSDQLQNFSNNGSKVQNVIHTLLALTQNHLQYHYGSADPKTGGMDCSGTIYYLLTTSGVKEVPRSAQMQYLWVQDKGHFYPITTQSINDLTLSQLKPGDLLFWTGTYPVDNNSNTVTHVMMYIGKNLEGQPLMAGSSDGRTYKGRRIYGVSVFDFQLPKQDSHSHFIGYSCIPDINCIK